ncbi:hypothetical protein GCM10008937_15520 [Deinococcus depolymerans]|uniref:Uncharacterized protein n=1 Tax=Deinococcus depolymerans TaxID=392408 RepID=A0ABN1C154_9DEIO
MRDGDVRERLQQDQHFGLNGVPDRSAAVGAGQDLLRVPVVRQGNGMNGGVVKGLQVGDAARAGRMKACFIKVPRLWFS